MELAQTFPLHVVCSWIGNSEAVSLEHNLTVTGKDFVKAVTCSALQNALQFGAESSHTATHGTHESSRNTVFLDNSYLGQYPRQDSNLGPAV